MPTTAIGRRAMASCAHPLATEAALSILQRGGNAFDAAVTTAAALNVVEPQMSGMGGYGTILLYDATKRQCRFLNTSDRFPRNANSDLFRRPTPRHEMNRRGPMAVSTPGNVRGWQAMSHTYGSLPWADLLQPAINMAEEGFAISAGLAKAIRRNYASFPGHARQIYGRDGKPLRVGDRLVQKDLAQSLSQLADEGPEAFYTGSLGRRIVSALKSAGSFLTARDLALCQAEWWEPIAINYRGHRVVTASPPATSFAALIRLGMMSQYDLQALGHNSSAALHRFVEVTKHAYWCRLKYAADPGVKEVPLGELLSPTYWQQAVGRLNIEQAKPFAPPSVPRKRGGHTTHYVVADSLGNIVSATQTVGQLFGCRFMPPGTGIWLNNSLQYCTFEPKGSPMDAHPGRRKLSGDCPVIIFREDIPWAALGSPGGHTIPQTVPQIVMNLIDFGMDVTEAIAQPRISFAEPNQLLVDPELPSGSKLELSKLGHEVTDFADGLGNAHGLTIEYGDDHQPVRFSGAADPRGEGVALGL